MSDVALAGEWKEAERRNQEVLLSLNHSRWACHFTTAANLTSCTADAARWLTFIKNLTAPSEFTMELGFVPQGHDVQPPQNITAAACKAGCAKAAACKAVSFRQSEAEQNSSSSKVLCYSKTVASFTKSPKSNCIADAGEGKPSCAPLPGEMGLGGYYGHYQGHWLSATAFLYNTTSNATVKAAAAKNVAVFAGVMEAWKGKYGVDGYLFPYDPVVWDKLLSGHGAYPYYSVPFYTLHKLMAGLLDQYLFAGNEQAFELVQKMALWVHTRVEAVIAGEGGMELWQKVLGTEWGGMNDVLFNVFEHTGNPVIEQTARRFNAFVFTARLAAGQDDLSKLPFPHANFHLPEVVGNARAYQLSGNETDKAIVDTFFDALLANHSYATGGSNSGECWQAPRDLAHFLDDQTEESCTQYNVLKVARRAFITSADADKADFYERAILNGIMGNQNKQDPDGATSYIYMLPLGGVNTKPWGKSDFGFPCCWGTLSESFAKLGDSIFFWGGALDPYADGGALYVNQFVSATAKLRHLPGEVSVQQQAHFPLDATRTSTLTVKGAGTFALMIRVPAWATSSKNAVSINGVPVAEVGRHYLRLHKTWKDGDTVEVSFPLGLWSSPLNDYHAEQNATIAFMYGPLVLAGVNVSTDVWVPKGGPAAAKKDPASFITRTSKTELVFEGVGEDGAKIAMIPLKDVMSEHYVAYFMTAGTKPAQKPNGYCPHSVSPNGEEPYPYEQAPADVDPEVSAGPPVPPPLDGSTSKHFAVNTVTRGVGWRIVDGRLASHPARSFAN